MTENETELKDQEQRRSRFKNVLLGAGVLLIGVMMLGGFTSHRHHHANYGARAGVVAAEAEQAPLEGQSAANNESNGEQEEYHQRHKSQRRNGHGHGHHRGFFALRAISRLAGVALLVGGLAMFWRNRNPDRAYAGETMQQHMSQEFEDDASKANPDV